MPHGQRQLKVSMKIQEEKKQKEDEMIEKGQIPSTWKTKFSHLKKRSKADYESSSSSFIKAEDVDYQKYLESNDKANFKPQKKVKRLIKKTGVQYFDKKLKEQIEGPFQLMIGDEETDQLTKKYLQSVLDSIPFDDKPNGNIIEVMAGLGRNFEVYKQLFKNHEILDGCHRILKLAPKNIKIHETYLEDFTFKSNHFDCILGVFCLSYIQDDEIRTVLQNMKQGMKKKGFIVLFEPIFDKDNKDEFEELQEQKLQIRTDSFYRKKFDKQKLIIYQTMKHNKGAKLTHPLRSYVLSKNKEILD